MRHLLAFALALATLLACIAPSGSSPVVLAIDPRAAPWQRAGVREMAARWNDLAIDRITVAEPGPWRLVLDAPPEPYWGWTDYSAQIILVRPDLDDYAFRRVVLHELGHALGLCLWKHTTDGGVMTAGSGALEFSAGDRAECRRVNACR